MVKGDSGTELIFTVKDEKGIVPLDGATVTLKISKGNTVISKPCTITDAVNGKCSVILSGEDTNTTELSYQVHVSFNDKSFSNEISILYFGESI